MAQPPAETKGACVLPELPDAWRIQLQLPCALLCGYDIPPYVANHLRNLRNVSLMELYLHLQGVKPHVGLEAAINTQHRRDAITAAYCGFYKVLAADRRSARGHSRKIAWIMPDSYLTSDGLLRKSHMVKMISSIVYSFDTPNQIGADVAAWLPWTSLSMVSHLRRWRTPRINAIRRALFKVAASIDTGTESYYPWSPGYSPDLARIPIFALCAYESSSLTVSTVRTLDTLGLTMLGDLRCFHPDAVVCAKLREEPLLKLYRLFRS